MDIEEAPLTGPKRANDNKSAIIAVLMAAFVVTTFGFVSLLTSSWAVSADVQVGLWQFCLSTGSCQPLQDVLEYLVTVRGFMVFSVCVSAILMFSSCALSFFPRREIVVLWSGVVFFSVCAISNIVAGSVFSAEYKLKPGVAFGYSFILVWIGAIFSLFGGFASLLASLKYP